MESNLASLTLEDLTPGDKFVSPGVTLTEAEIIGFALKYDPQPFHLDTGAAEASIYGGLIASGFQVVSLCFRMFIQMGLFRTTSMGSPGIDELRWLAPVRPGDTLRTEVEVGEVKPSRSKPDRGIARLHYRAINQRGETVTSFVVNHLLRTRAAT
jgi:acyl dehydratase